MFDYHEMKYTTLITPQNDEKIITDFITDIISTSWERIFDPKLIMVHIYFIIVNLQKQNISAKIILDIYDVLTLSVIKWILSYKGPDIYTIFDIIYSAYINYTEQKQLYFFVMARRPDNYGDIIQVFNQNMPYQFEQTPILKKLFRHFK